MRRTALAALMGLVLFGAGCTIRPSALTIVSTRNVDLHTIERARAGQHAPEVEGSDVQYFILFLPVTGAPSLQEAVERALDKAQGDCLLDATVRSDWACRLIYSRRGLTVRGNALKTYQVDAP
jgi:hypothetical protein